MNATPCPAHTHIDHVRVQKDRRITYAPTNAHASNASTGPVVLTSTHPDLRDTRPNLQVVVRIKIKLISNILAFTEIREPAIPSVVPTNMQSILGDTQAILQFVVFINITLISDALALALALAQIC